MLAAGFGAAAVGGLAAAYEIGKFADHSVKAAASFQQANTLLTTQAGVARSQINGLATDFLTMAPKLAQTPQALSEGFYHIASALGKFGYSTKSELNVMTAAAQGAAVGNANLEDTVNSLVGALASGVGGIKNAHDAMATILAIVGAGNMRLQEFNSAMGTGLPGALKTFGVSLQSGGAALSYLTDTGMRAQMAATRLTMAIALLGGPSQHAANLLHAVGLASSDIHTRFAVVTQMLQKAGLSFSQLATDMKKPDGIVVALQDLKRHMEQAGMSASLQAAFISRAFGGGHMGKAIMQIFENLPRVGDAFKQINKTTSDFGKHWQETTKNAIFQAHSLHAATSAISTGIGEALLPAVQKLLAALVPIVSAVAEFTAHHKTLAAIILGTAFAVAILTAGIGMLGLAFLALDSAAAPWIAIALAVIAVIALIAAGVYEIVKHWGAITKFFAGVWSDVRKIFHEALADIVPWLSTEWNRISSDAISIWRSFEGWMGTLWGDVRNAAVSAWTSIVDFLDGLWSSVQAIANNAWEWIKDFPSLLWTWFKEGFEKAWDAISDVANTVFGWFETAWNTAWGWIKTAGATLWDWFRTGWDTAWNAISTLGSQAWGWFKAGFDASWSALSGVAAWTWNSVFKPAWDATWGALRTVGATLWSWFKAGFNAAWSALGDAARWTYNAIFKPAFDKVWGGLKSIGSTLWGWFKAGFNASWSALSGVATWTYNSVFKPAWDKVWGDLRLAPSRLWGDFKSAWGKGWSGAEDLGTKTGRSIIDGIINIINKGIDKINSIIGGISGAWSWAGIPSIQKIPHIPQLAAGGIVMSPTLAVVGEAGPEAVIPLSDLGAFGSTAGSTTVIFDFRGSQVMSDNDIRRLSDVIGAKLTQIGLPMAGMQVRRS